MEFDKRRGVARRLRVNEHIVRAETALRSVANGQVQAAAASLRRAAASPDPFRLGENKTYARVLERLGQSRDDVEAQEELSQLNLISHVVTRTKKREAYPDAPKRDPVIYVTPAELHIFVADFLPVEHPASSLRPRFDGTKTRDAGEGCWWLRMTASLREFVRQRTKRLDDPALLRFLQHASAGDMRVTFDPQAALVSPSIEHIHNQHPLVKAIASFLAENPDRIQPVCRAVLRTDSVPQADYAYYWAEVVAHDGTGRLEPDVAERVLYEMIVAGEAWPDFKPPDYAAAAALVSTFEAWIGERCSLRRAAAQEQNDTRVNARLASLRASADAKEKIVQGQLERHRANGNVRILPAVEGKLRKIEADFEQRQRQLEAGRNASLSYTAGGFGFVRVLAKS